MYFSTCKKHYQYKGSLQHIFYHYYRHTYMVDVILYILDDNLYFSVAVALKGMKESM